MHATRWPLALWLAVTLSEVLVPASASAETVLARRRLGNNTEGLTYDSRNDRAVALDGDDVIGIALNPLDAVVLATMGGDDGGINGRGYRKLFDVLGLDPVVHDFQGLVYVPTQDRYYFTPTDATIADRLFSCDAEGHPRPTLRLKGLADLADWEIWEGMAWIPPDAPAHGGTIAALGARSDSISHLFYIRLDGTVESELVPQPGTPLEDYFCGVHYWAQHPGTLLLTKCVPADLHSQVWAMDMRTGALVGDPGRPLITSDEPGDAEGVIVRRNGQVLISEYESGRLAAYDASFQRTTGEDRLFVVGLGVSARRLTWNPDANEFIAVSSESFHVYGISRDLRSAHLLFDVDVNHDLPNPQGGLAYLGGGQLAIGNRSFPRGIDLTSLSADPNVPPSGVGYSMSRLLFLDPAFPGGPFFNPIGIGALGSDRFLVRVLGDRSVLRIVSRTGVPDSSIYPDGVLPTYLGDLHLSSPASGTDAQVFGDRIFTGREIYDLSTGQLLHTVDAEKLRLQHLGGETGTWLSGNTFANEDGRTSTVVVYSIP
ncbi:MAG TPA: hypothetical protein VMT11_06625 [Myxococcaceae bacterium]|nr:hypothetical protein [Myxococcaceae bacterium]